MARNAFGLAGLVGEEAGWQPQPAREQGHQPVAQVPADPMGKMFFNILATFAEFEVDLLKMRTREEWPWPGPGAG